MCIGIVDTLTAEPFIATVDIQKIIGITHAMAALEKHRATISIANQLRHTLHIFRRVNGLF